MDMNLVGFIGKSIKINSLMIVAKEKIFSLSPEGYG